MCRGTRGGRRRHYSGGDDERRGSSGRRRGYHGKHGVLTRGCDLVSLVNSYTVVTDNHQCCGIAALNAMQCVHAADT